MIPLFPQTRTSAESDDIDPRHPKARCLYEASDHELRLLTWVPISVAVLENIPPMLAVASAMMRALDELVTIAVTKG